jgi:3-oxoacyl-[acyl-carrier-protein] synthase-3
MPRAVIVGSGSEIPPLRVTNAMLARIMDTSDEWIRERSGVEARHFVEEGVGTSDLGVAAARRALERAGLETDEVDLVVFATMTPDHFFPGSGALLQAKLGLRQVPCFDIRQQCVGFLYGLQLADAHVRAGLARTVLLVGAEVHTGFMPWTRANWDFMLGRGETPPTPEELAWNNKFRHLTVLFGDGAAAVVLKAADDGGSGAQPRSGVSPRGPSGLLDHELHTDGRDYDKLYVPGTGFKRRPYTDPGQFARGEHIPVMDGRYVFKMATTRMIESGLAVLGRNGLSVADLKLVLMHQANLRINEYCQKSLGLPDEKVVSNIERYGNTTAATIPLLWDVAQRAGRLEPGDLVLALAFGAGMNWGATLLRA